MPKNNDILWGSQVLARKTDRKVVKRETIEEFLARGGKIQRVAPGAGRIPIAEIEQEDWEAALDDFKTTVNLK